MNIVFSKHAEEEMIKRKIDRTLVLKAINSPDSKLDINDRNIFQLKYFDEINNKEMLLRVFAKEDIKDLKVITVYKTSKISKYMR